MPTALGPSTEERRRETHWLFAVQIALLVLAGVRNAHQINPDAIAYLRLAGYYAEGQFDLAVSGYWGPLLIWSLVPFLKVGVAPLVAARIVMGISAVIFLVGARAVFREFRLPVTQQRWGGRLAAAVSVFWSVRNITPDLLMGGLVALAVAGLVGGRWLAHRGVARCLGVGWGLAYLAKAVALPLAILVTAVLAGIWWRRAAGRREFFWRQLAQIALAASLVALPWMLVLSFKYGRFTFSTTGPIAHALAGPAETAGYHPALSTLHQPEPGRLTQWEEPSRMAYRHWSPGAGGENARHQAQVVLENAGTMTRWLSGVSLAEAARWWESRRPQNAVRALPGFDLFGLSLIAVIGGGVLLIKRQGRGRWTWAVLPVVCLAGLYLPFWVQPEDQRYFYPVWPFAWVAVAGLCALVSREWPKRIGIAFQTVVARLPVIAFAVPALLWLAVALAGLPNTASRAAQELAGQLRTAQVTGPVAGSALLPGGRAGLYTAFLLGERWLGDDPGASPDDFARAGARLVIVTRGSPGERGFEGAAGWRDLHGPRATGSPNVDGWLRVFQRTDAAER